MVEHVDLGPTVRTHIDLRTVLRLFSSIREYNPSENFQEALALGAAGFVGQGRPGS